MASLPINCKTGNFKEHFKVDTVKGKHLFALLLEISMKAILNWEETIFQAF